MNERSLIREITRLVGRIIRRDHERQEMTGLPIDTTWFALGHHVQESFGVIADVLMSTYPMEAEYIAETVNDARRLSRLLPSALNLLDHATEFRIGKHRIYVSEEGWEVQYLEDAPDHFGTREEALRYVRGQMNESVE